jgi:1,4-dihydroxy-2-naphthoate octaprenyltransferase
MLTLKEHNREEGARSWVLALGYIGTALGTVYAFGLFFGSFMILGDILDQT